MRAAIYARISNDKTGAGMGVERQREDCAQLAERLGWDIVETFADNDISAYSGKPRPAYRQMLEAIEEGRINAVIAWHTDRLHRSNVELETFIDLCERHQVEIQTVQAGKLDLSTPTGRMVARIVGAVARHEIDHARQRMILAHRDGAKAGRAHGKIPFGYQAVVNEETGKITGRVPHPVEAPAFQDAVQRILKGESMYSVRQDWKSKGIVARNGRPWDSTNFKQMLLRPTYAALRTHKGVVTKGSWDPLITEDEHHQLVALLSSPARVSPRGSAPRHLLTGIAKCGECGKPCWRLKSNGKDGLSCQDRCVYRSMAPVDAMVTEVILRWAESKSGPDSLTDPATAEAVEEARALQARLDAATASAVDGTISFEMLGNLERALLPKIRRLEKRARAVPQPEVLELLGSNARAHWERMDVVARRTVVRSLLSVTILKAKRGRVFSPDSIRVQWVHSS